MKWYFSFLRTGLLCAYSLLLSPFAFAQTPTALCQVKSTQDILQCALKNHPEVLQSAAQVRRDATLQKVARQWSNPELEGKVVAGKNGGSRLLNTETSLLQTIETGGKRGARITKALAEQDFSQALHLESQELAALNTVLSLYRLRQIRSELSLVNESITTFSRILSQYKSRPKLPPEQEVSLAVFELAKQEYGLKRASLVQEQNELQAFLEVATTLPYSQIQRYLPGLKRGWPRLSAPYAQTAQNSDVKKAEADFKISQAKFKAAKSDAWPDFKLGPTIETETQAQDTATMAGMRLALPLPILSQNHGAKSYAKLDEMRSHLILNNTLRKTEIERVQQIKRYQNALSALNLYAAQGANDKHRKIEDFFEKGLISSSLVMESHRQLYEIAKTRNEQELTALDALWRVRIIDGTFLAEKL